jgi:8-amino-7-oxononanoate synthase
VIELVSSLYLGLAHPSNRLPEWKALTAGVPAALQEPPGAKEVAARTRRLLGAATTFVAPSTLHAFIDVAAALTSHPARPAALAVDVAAYPIGRIGLGRGLQPGARRIASLPHFHPESAARWARRQGQAGKRPVLLIDGLCPGCGRIAPLEALSRAVGVEGGVLIVDDTQALGIVGFDVGDGHPWGHSGGGSLARAGCLPNVIVVASMAKAFGAPVAVVGGPAEILKAGRPYGPTFAHSSPPSVPALLAAGRALQINDRLGDVLRGRLLERVLTLRDALRAHGLSIDSGLFPVVRIPVGSGLEAVQLAGRLCELGVRGVPLGPSCRGRPALGLAVTAVLPDSELRRAAAAVATAVERAA